MTDHLKTIRENAERVAHNSTDDPRSCGYAILTAIDALEAAMKTPVAEVAPDGVLRFWTTARKFEVGSKLYMDAPPAKQGYSASDMASAAAQGFRDGQAAQQAQAEAVPADFRDRLVAISQAIADQDDRAAQAMIREILAAPQQAEVLPNVQIVNCGTCKHTKAQPDDYPCNRCGVEFGDGPFNRWEAAPQQAEAVPQWQPIETAPKDGTVVDLWHSEFGRMPGWFWGLPHHCCGEMGSLCDSDWHSLEPGWVDEFNEPHSVDVDATHWMPLPAAPQPKEQSNG